MGIKQFHLVCTFIILCYCTCGVFVARLHRDLLEKHDLRIENATEESEKKGLEQELELHQTLAKTGYETFSYDQKLSKESWKAVQTHPNSN